jgi:shikimate dehydrogenase
VTTERQAAVLGSPIAHSLSPVLHRAAYQALNLDWTYRAVEVDQMSLAQFWSDLDETWVGLSLTMPLKMAVMPFLDHVSPRGLAIQAVNTVVFDQGQAFGHNTDIPGMIRALDAAQPQPGDTRSASILGGGATARSAVAALIERHGHDVPISICARRDQQAHDLVALALSLGGHAHVLGWNDRTQAMAADVVISTIPGGSDAQVILPSSPGVLLDVAYDPWPSEWVARWRSAGGSAATGADLLLWQAAHQVELMTGQAAPVAAMRDALTGALNDRVQPSI